MLYKVLFTNESPIMWYLLVPSFSQSGIRPDSDIVFPSGESIGKTTLPSKAPLIPNPILKYSHVSFLNLSKISWNEEGRGILLSVLSNCINLAKRNGVVSIGKPLNNTQKLYIKQVTNEDEAWREIQDNGYWLDVSLQYDTDTQGIVTHKAVYKLLYSKDDVIRKVEASHILL